MVVSSSSSRRFARNAGRFKHASMPDRLVNSWDFAVPEVTAGAVTAETMKRRTSARARVEPSQLTYRHEYPEDLFSICFQSV
jgi:hypothetical protein